MKMLGSKQQFSERVAAARCNRESCNKPQSNRIELVIGNKGSYAMCLAANTKHTEQPEMKMRSYLQTGDRVESSVNGKFSIAD